MCFQTLHIAYDQDYTHFPDGVHAHADCAHAYDDVWFQIHDVYGGDELDDVQLEWCDVRVYGGAFLELGNELLVLRLFQYIHNLHRDSHLGFYSMVCMVYTFVDNYSYYSISFS